MLLKVEKDIPFGINKARELTEALVALKEGDSVYLSYEEFTRTVVYNCMASARLRLAYKGLKIRTEGNKNGRRLWILKILKES